MDESGDVIKVYLVPLSAITPGSPQVIVGTTRETVNNDVYLWKRDPTIKPDVILPEHHGCCTFM